MPRTGCRHDRYNPTHPHHTTHPPHPYNMNSTIVTTSTVDRTILTTPPTYLHKPYTQHSQHNRYDPNAL
jgi:hypothetical protein